MWASIRNRTLLLAMLLGFLASASVVALMGVSAWLIATAATQPPVLTLTVAAVSVRFFALGRAVFRYAERLVGHDSAFRGLTSLRVRIYDALERIAPVGLARYSRGDLLTRIVADVDAALDLSLRVVLPWAQGLLVAAATVAFLLWLAPLDGVFTAVLAAISLLALPAWAAWIARNVQRRFAPLQARLASSVEEQLRASEDLEVFGADAAVRERTREIDASLTRVARNQAWALGSTTGLATTLTGIAVVVALMVGIPAVTNGTLAPVWLAVIALLPIALFDVLATLPTSALSLQRVRSSADRLSAVIDEPSPVAQTGAIIVNDQPLTITMRDVGASWSDEQAIGGVTLEFRPGMRLGIVGPSGSGKSTLAAVLMRFLEYTGSIVVNGVELRELDADAYRGRIGYLGQSSHLFDTTIAQNLRLAKPDASDVELVECLDRVRLGAWLQTLPSGLATDVGSFGVAVSGGERQRIALARLLLQDRAFVLVDEPTEHLDVETAAQLEHDLITATQGRTTVVISHRLSALVEVDHIVVMDRGTVVDQGTHAELLERNTWFGEQWLTETESMALLAAISDIQPGGVVRR